LAGLGSIFWDGRRYKMCDIAVRDLRKDDEETILKGYVVEEIEILGPKYREKLEMEEGGYLIILDTGYEILMSEDVLDKIVELRARENPS
jgi:hypothetical protein